MKISLVLLATAATSFAALPSVGPDYARPPVSAPAAFRDAADLAAWKTAAPADTTARGE